MVKKVKRQFKWAFISIIGFLVIIANLSMILQIVYPLPYREEILQQCNENQADKALVLSVIYSESRFRPKAVSPAGAKGLMQIMPITGEWIAQHMKIEDYSEEKLFDPSTNISMGIWYIGWLEKQFNQEMAQVLAAYNAGPGNVKKWLETGIWDGSQLNVDNIPFKETRDYVKRVLSQYISYNKIYQNFIKA